MSFRLLLLSVFLVFTIKSQAQTGPGGVGNNTSNVLWLEADAITTLADGADVATWADGSGNANDVSQPTTSLTPIFKTGIINGLPVVRFNKTNGRIRKTGFTGFPTTAITEIYVNATADNGEATLSYASAGSDNDFLLFNSSNLGIYRNSFVNSGIAFNDNNFHITGASWQSAGGSTELWKDGNKSFTTSFKAGSSITTGGCLAIAGEQDAIDGSYASNQTHFGDFSEVLIFNMFLNTAQHIIVSNYLAAKYNLSITNDYFSYQSSHQYDVAGIGREDASNIHSAAMSANILQIENASGLNANQEYLIFGHDNTDISTAWTTTEAPNGGVDYQRLVREWRVTETGDVGTIDIKIDVATFPALPALHTMYAIMVDADGDFSNGATVYELALVAGTTYDAIGIAIADGDFIAIAAVEPKIQHTLIASNDFEPNNASINVSLNFIARTAKTVDFTTADGTALVAQPDYNAAVATTVTIPAGSSNANYLITITNDVVIETSETLTSTLSNPSVGINLGANIVHTYTIKDDDDARKVYFDLAASNGDESISPVTVNMSINNVDAINPTTVDYIVSGGTAIGSGTDYTLATGTVTFPPGTTTGSFTISINDDALYENNETIIVNLSNPTNCNIDGTIPFGGTGFITHTYTIDDNDTPPIIQFTNISSSGSEAVSPVNFQVELNIASGVDASATFTLTGTAIGSGSDYTIASGLITILSGNTTANITAIIIDDAIEELAETMILTLSLPINATSSGNTVYTYTIIDNDIFGYVGPGGVGQASNNKLWVKSNDLAVVADGTNITSWADASGNTNNLSQSNTSFTPRYYTSIVNGQPVVRFEQSNNRLIHNSFTDFPTNNITTIIVNSNGDSGDGVLSYASTASDNDYLWFSSNNIRLYRGSSNVGSGTSINGGAFRVLSNTWEGSTGNTRFYRNGTQTYNGTLAAGTNITAGGNFSLAGEQDAINGGYSAGQSHQGDFTEAIIYNTVLNSARQIIVNNYLSAKYDIALATNDLYDEDDIGNGNYDYEVAGIGKVNNTNFHQDAQGTAIVRILNPSTLKNDEFLIWGHDNGILLASNTTDVPASMQARFERVWRASEVSTSLVPVDVGSIDMRFDLTGLGSVTASDLRLLVDTDNDGVFADETPISGATNISGNIYQFAGITAIANNLRFTIGTINKISTPLPTELISFNVYNIDDKKVEIEWQTATEINNDYFSIERSKNNLEWELITEVNGAGNSSVLLNYTYLDNTPYENISYYRLKQTDFNGTYSYSKIKTVNIKGNKNSIIIYPNPTNNQITITGESTELGMIIIYNNQGKDVTNNTTVKESNKQKIVIDLSHLSSGIYYIKTKTTTNKIYKQ